MTSMIEGHLLRGWLRTGMVYLGSTFYAPETMCHVHHNGEHLIFNIASHFHAVYLDCPHYTNNPSMSQHSAGSPFSSMSSWHILLCRFEILFLSPPFSRVPFRRTEIVYMIPTCFVSLSCSFWSRCIYWRIHEFYSTDDHFTTEHEGLVLVNV
ncbi:hypothetical protein PILCRDRAFT_304712 [Piloderma croceum F 1598]|uniref:Uncharacterized protein n=1 Tax=Piloderma croceum (strain F 1598) TaxID=765440 RepID=A0A0C3FSN3_PILCF|nr:hypothetical protein PILCRDRAFT_304712 [Piloderma croceum F 1598]